MKTSQSAITTEPEVCTCDLCRSLSGPSDTIEAALRLTVQLDDDAASEASQPAAGIADAGSPPKNQRNLFFDNVKLVEITFLTVSMRQISDEKQENRINESRF